MLFSWRRFREGVTAVLHLHDDEPSRIAGGMAVGVFIGFTPFYGLHTLLALAAAFVLRLNKAATVTAAWFNLPWFAPFVYAFCAKLGEAILSGNFSWAGLGGLVEGAGAYLRGSPREHAWAFWQMIWRMMFEASLPLFVGTTVVGLVLGTVTYFITLEAVREIRRLRHRARGAGPPETRPSPEEPRPR